MRADLKQSLRSRRAVGSMTFDIAKAVPHLAGALARLVWVMLAFMRDWRWLLGRDTSPVVPNHAAAPTGSAW